jgi:hypothetical protein
MEQKLNPVKPVSVPSAAFAFCRYTLALLVWATLLLRYRPLMILVFILFTLSAVLKVRRAPLILLYSATVNKICKSPDEVLNEAAMRFAHTLGAVFSLVCIGLLYFAPPVAGWSAVLVFAILKSISAFGYCPASKLYECLSNGGCCAFTRKHG